jgi:hypothetical protein
MLVCVPLEETPLARFPMLTIVLCSLSFPHAASATCTCIYTGGTVKEGETACIWTAKGNTLARCEKVLNNTSWTVLNKPCSVNQSSVQGTTSIPQSG